MLKSITNRFWTDYFRYYDVLLHVLPYQALHERLGECLDLDRGSLVLDAGAGTGNTTVILRDRGWRWISLDLNRAGLRRVRRKVGDPRPVVADLRAPLPFPDACFDGVLSSNVLYDLPKEDRLPALFELCRVMKPDGRIVVHNLVEGFDALTVYRRHLVSAIREHGLLSAVLKATRFIWPTIQLLRMNRVLVRGEESKLFRPGEQAKLLNHAGFSSVSDEEAVYAEQGALCHAACPSHSVSDR